MTDPVKKEAQKRIHQAQAEGRPIMDKINKAVVIARRRAELEKERAERRAREAGQGPEETVEGLSSYIKSMSSDESTWDQKDRIATQQARSQKGKKGRPLGASFFRNRRAAQIRRERGEAQQGEQGETKTEGYMGKMDSLGKKMGKLSRKLTKRVD